MAVGRQEALEVADARMAVRGDDHRPARVLLHQGHAAQDQGAHDALAQFGLRDQEHAQRLGRQRQHVERADGDGVFHRRAAGQLPFLAAELAGAEQRHRLVHAEAVVAPQQQFAGQDEQHGWRALAGLEHGVAVAVVARLAELPHMAQVIIAEDRKDLVAALLEVRTRQRRNPLRSRNGSRRIGHGVFPGKEMPSLARRAIRGPWPGPGARPGGLAGSMGAGAPCRRASLRRISVASPPASSLSRA